MHYLIINFLQLILKISYYLTLDIIDKILKITKVFPSIFFKVGLNKRDSFFSLAFMLKILFYHYFKEK